MVLLLIKFLIKWHIIQSYLLWIESKSTWKKIWYKKSFFLIFPFLCTFCMMYFFFNLHAKEKSITLSTPRIWCRIFLELQIYSIMYYKLERMCKIFSTHYWIGKYAFNRRTLSIHRNTHPILMKISGYTQLLMLYQTI